MLCSYGITKWFFSLANNKIKSDRQESCVSKRERSRKRERDGTEREGSANVGKRTEKMQPENANGMERESQSR